MKLFIYSFNCFSIKLKSFLIFKKIIKLFQKNRPNNAFEKRSNPIKIIITLKGLKESKIMLYLGIIIFLNKIKIIYNSKKGTSFFKVLSFINVI